MHTPVSSLKPVSEVLPAVYSAGTDTGAGLDTLGADYAVVTLHAGLATATGTLTATVEESSDDAVGDAYVAITGAAFAVVTVSADNLIFQGSIRLHGRERYIRFSGVTATDDVTYSASIQLFNFADTSLQDVSYAFEV